jgi:hypothetical protein
VRDAGFGYRGRNRQARPGLSRAKYGTVRTNDDRTDAARSADRRAQAGAWALDPRTSSIRLTSKALGLRMRDYDRLASLFTHDGAVRIPHINAEAAGREQIRAGNERLQALLEFFVQSTHPGTIKLADGTASGRAYICELGRFRDGSSELNYAIYHDRYQRTGNGWKFTERIDEIRYLDTTPLADLAPHAAEAPANPPTANLRGR